MEDSEQSQRILVFSGKKQSGKNTLADFCEFIFKYEDKSFKQYAFADKLKKICVEVFLIPPELVYGDNGQKDQLTEYIWEDMPGYALTEWYEIKTGRMTVREFIQYLGTEVFRKIYGSVWARACLHEVKREKYAFATISDCRFKEEVEMAKQYGAKVIRLTRAPYQDLHSSEISLDPDKFNWEGFDYIINNDKQTQAQTYAELMGVLDKWGWL